MRGGHPLRCSTLSVRMCGLCLVVVMTIAGCTREKPPATPTATPERQEVPVESTSVPLAADASVAPTTVRYTVQAGDTLWAIANRFGVTLQSLAEANEMLEPDRLQPGQDLIIPVGGDTVTREPLRQEPSVEQSEDLESQRIHTVTAGETLWSIAMRYGTRVDEIVRLNSLDPDQFLQIGQRLLIP